MSVASRLSQTPLEVPDHADQRPSKRRAAGDRVWKMSGAGLLVNQAMSPCLASQRPVLNAMTPIAENGQPPRPMTVTTYITYQNAG